MAPRGQDADEVAEGGPQRQEEAREQQEEEEVSSGASHPLRVKPSGNEFFMEADAVLRGGLAALGRLEDPLLLSLLGFLDAKALAVMGTTCQTAFVYCSAEALWKDLALASWRGQRFLGSWKHTVLGREPPKRRFVPRAAVCSDELYRPWQYACAELKPEWLKRQAVDTREAGDLSVEAFVSEFEAPCKPVLIKNALRWPCATEWASTNAARPQLTPLEGCDTPLRVGPVDMPLSRFLEYCERQQEEAPLYLFDCRFVERIRGETSKNCSSSSIYEVPRYFANSPEFPHRDLFEAMGERRPDYRWLIAGSAKSGSKWHIDPNMTHAWNGVVSGSKRWLMFPPGHAPPGVTPSADGAEVTQPVSLLEWFANFWSIERAPVEFTAEAGDLVFVPSGWWHCVLNLEPCVAITQNYVSSSNLGPALALMRDQAHLVSGLDPARQRSGLYHEFRTALMERFTGLVEGLEEAEQERKRRRIDTSQDRDFAFAF